MKKCSTCKVSKPVSDFGKDASRKDLLRTYCKACAKAHRSASAESAMRWREANRESSRLYSSSYYDSNKETLLEKQRQYRERNPDRVKESRRRHYEKNKESILSAAREYCRKNPEKVRDYKRSWSAMAKSKRPEFALAVRYRKRVRMAVLKQSIKPGGKTQSLVGCTWLELKDHLESRFLIGMSWQNFSEWHIDHIIPLASAKSTDELAALCHYSNLQPLWPLDNLKKGASMPCRLKRSA